MSAVNTFLLSFLFLLLLIFLHQTTEEEEVIPHRVDFKLKCTAPEAAYALENLLFCAVCVQATDMA